jgi:hypothetical protein
MFRFFIIKPSRCTNFSNLFLEWNSTCFGQFLCPSSGVFHCTHSNGICNKSLLCVQCKTPDDGRRNCPKHVEIHSKNKLEKIVHIVGFIIRNLSRCTVTWTSKTCFGLYICSYFQAVYRTLDQKSIKYNTVELWGRDVVCMSMCIYTKPYKMYENMWSLQMSCLKIINTRRAYIHQ